MTPQWTPEQAAALASDDKSLKAARGLATPRKWSGLGRDEAFLWGLAQGSGAEPYKVQIDLREPAFACSCPSHKFPCKHGLGLLLLWTENPPVAPPGAQPDWVAAWAAKRAARAEKAAEKVAEKAAVAVAQPASEPPTTDPTATLPTPDGARPTPEPEGRDKRREKRDSKMQAGMDYLAGWLSDLMRRGLATTQGVGYEFWDTPVRRLIDAQAPGLARRVRLLGELADGRPGWEERLLAGIGRLHLLLVAAGQRAESSPELAAEVDDQLGWNVNQDELLQGATAQAADWLSIAQQIQEAERLQTRQTWLLNREGRFAVHFQFAFGGRPMAEPMPVGRWLRTALVFYPGLAPLRALMREPGVALPDWHEPPARTLWEDCLADYATTLGRNPWREEQPFLLAATPVLSGSTLYLRDAAGESLPLPPQYPRAWHLLALAGGRTLPVCGLWNGWTFRPLSIVQDQRVISLEAQA